MPAFFCQIINQESPFLLYELLRGGDDGGSKLLVAPSCKVNLVRVCVCILIEVSLFLGASLLSEMQCMKSMTR